MKKLQYCIAILAVIFLAGNTFAEQGRYDSDQNAYSKIYVVGHKAPDLDSVAAAISYAKYRNAIEKTDQYLPVAAGNINIETDYVLNKFGFPQPSTLKNGNQKNLILVDHNEFSQSVYGIEGANITEVLDHHNINFHYAEPIRFEVLPWGSTCSIIARKYFDNDLEINPPLAALMLAAILVDTVMTKSPTCTVNDKNIIDKLAPRANIRDWKAFGLEIFRVRSTVSKSSDEKIINGDFKDYLLKAGKFGLGQVETVDLTEFKGRENDLLNKMNRIKEDGSYHMVILFITDIINEGSLFLVAVNNPAEFEITFGTKLKNGQAYIPGIISRKKQVVPRLIETFDR